MILRLNNKQKKEIKKIAKINKISKKDIITKFINNGIDTYGINDNLYKKWEEKYAIHNN